MIIAFVTIGMVFGSVASGYVLVAGGSFLVALAIYSGIGIIMTLSAVAVSLLISGIRYTNDDWTETTAEGPVTPA